MKIEEKHDCEEHNCNCFCLTADWCECCEDGRCDCDECDICEEVAHHQNRSDLNHNKS